MKYSIYRYLFFTLFSFMFFMSLKAQKISEYYDIKFHRLSTDNLLPSNIIAGVVQDKNGFLWIGTSNGLVRYDGVKAKLFQNIQSDSTSIPSNLIRSILIDPKGVIWLGTVNGIVKFDPALEKFTDIHNKASLSKLRGYYSRLYLDSKGRLSSWDMNSKVYIVIDTETANLIAIIDKKTVGSNDWISGERSLLFVDQDDFWFATSKGELLISSLKDNKISTIITDINKNPSLHKNFSTMYMDRKGNIYCGGNGLFVLPVNKRSTYNFENINLNKGKNKTNEPDSPIMNIIEDKEGMIWFSRLNKGVSRYNPHTKETFEYPNTSLNHDGIRSNNAYFINDNLENIWVVHDNGILQLYDYNTKDLREFKHDPVNQTSISPVIYSDVINGKIFMDLSGNYWLPTQGAGLVYFSLKKTKFPVIKNLSNNMNSLAANGIWGIYEDKKGLLWVGIKNFGLNIVDMNSGSVSKYRNNSGPVFTGFEICTDFLQLSDNEYWIGSISLKRIFFDHTNRTFRLLNEFKHDINDPNSISGWVVTDVFRDRKGDVWVATFDGLNLYQKPNKYHPHGYFKHFTKEDKSATAIANVQVWHIMEDNSGRLWISTADGLSCINAERTKTINYYHNPQHGLSLASSNVKFTLQDSKGRIWIATEGGGLIQFKENENSFTDYNKTTGFPSNNIFAIFEDKSGNLWMSSTDGIIRFTPETNQICTFTGEDGLQSKQFVAGAFFQNPVTGKIYFGGDNGINHFYPDSIKLSTFVPNIVFESLRIANEEIAVKKEYKGNVVLSKALSNTDKLILSYKENIFSIEFAALDFSAANSIIYSHMLEGANDSWTETNADNKTLNYTNLAPGSYKLKVRSTNADGVWCDNVKTLTIIITPPWWQSFWFRAIVIFLIALGITVFLRFRINFLKNRNIELEENVRKRTAELQNANVLLEEKNEKINTQNHEIKAKQEEIINQAEHLHLVDQQKLQFLTNISHEFRTPLTLILGPTEKLIEQENSLPVSEKVSLYKMIQRNSFRLLRLVNQVLDISKVEAGELKLQIAKGDLLDHIKPICDSFIYIAEQKSIKFSFISNTESINAYFDADKVEKIIYNLLSNAFKFTGIGGKIEIVIEALWDAQMKTEVEEVIITISDNGIGIPEEKVKHIFERFYQVKSNIVKGTGIGLALTRDLIELHKGSIEVKSILSQSTIFTITLPLSKKIYENEDIEIEPQSSKVDQLNMALLQSSDFDANDNNQEALIDKKSKLPIVLIVEDNLEMRQFVVSELKDEYQIIEAKDGAKGIELALDKIPDLIISDIMMPFVDGLTLVNTLKKDKNTSHIPIILLTAKENHESRYLGYEIGADSYISKPFHISVLKARIINLLLIRQNLRLRYSSEILIDSSEIVLNYADEKFLNSAIEIIEQNSNDENFNVEKLANDLGIHRVQMSRKFLALTNENPSDFIRITRLKKAAKLLLSRRFSISEVCYQVGFKDPAHFTRIFSKQFNISPSKYIEENYR